jgi:hypothetical protein
MPEPSFLYHWMSNSERKQNIPLFTRLLSYWPYLYNIQVCSKCVQHQGAQQLVHFCHHRGHRQA